MLGQQHLEGCPRCIAIADIKGLQPCRAAALADVLGDGLGLIVAGAVIDNNVVAVLCQLQGNGAANAPLRLR